MQSVTGSRLIIGREALSALSSTFIQELLSFVDNGGRVLVLKQKGEQLKDSPLIPQGIVAKKYNSLFVNTERPGLLDKNLVNRNFFLWNPVEWISGFPVTEVFDIDHSVLAHTSVLENCGYLIEYHVFL